MNELLRCRAMEGLCRQRAVFFPEKSWHWLAEAEMWNQKAFECSNRSEVTNEAKSEGVSVKEKIFSRKEVVISAEISRKLSRVIGVKGCGRKSRHPRSKSSDPNPNRVGRMSSTVR